MIAEKTDEQAARSRGMPGGCTPPSEGGESLFRRGVAVAPPCAGSARSATGVGSRGFALDLRLPAAATLLPPAPARGGPVPSEEYLFYVGGFLFVLLLYIWCDEDFLLLYNVPDYREAWATTGRTRVAEFDAISLTGAAVLIAAAWVYKAEIARGPFRGGFPGYFAYLTLLGVAPAVGFLKTTRQFINWRAFAVTFQVVVAVSLLWEATLAAPLGWWRYQPGEMTGVVVEPGTTCR